MIEELRISSLGVIDSSVLELGPGLTVITGETGAGKTMVVTALGLLLGGRADAGSVRRGSKSARVEGLINAERLPWLADAVGEAGGEVEDDTVLLARTVAAEGRSRAFVGGASVPITTLAGVTEPLVAVHGQSDQHRLLNQRAQRDALDRFAGAPLAAVATSYGEAYRELVEVEQQLAHVTTHARERAREADVLRFGVGEVEAVAPQPGEDVTLAAEEARLGFSDTLRRAAENAREALSSEDGHPDALAAIAAARAELEGVRVHDTDAAGLADRVGDLTYLLSDLAADVASYAASVETDPARLAVVSERRAALASLTRKYGESIDEVLAWAEEASGRLLDLDGTDEQIDALRLRRAAVRERLAELATELSTLRTTAAATLSAQVTEELAQLAMPHARITITVGQVEADPSSAKAPLEVAGRHLRFGSRGVDEVEFLLAANTGSEPRPLNKGASGGELSRVMLGLEVALAGTSPVPTFVFDEVDSGVGGAAAVEVGRRLAQLARSAQVLVVTHLPQVAAYADRHVVVEKSHDGTITSSGLTVLDDAGRERELSRMLAGMADSDTALAHARELLDVARSGL
jgi:DNA repair protein RecN (Recombination protein N)